MTLGTAPVVISCSNPSFVAIRRARMLSSTRRSVAIYRSLRPLSNRFSRCLRRVSAGLLFAPSSQRSKSLRLTVCLTAGCRTVTIAVANLQRTSPAQGSALNNERACAMASYKVSAVTSTEWSVPFQSLIETVHACNATRRPFIFALYSPRVGIDLNGSTRLYLCAALRASPIVPSGPR